MLRDVTGACLLGAMACLMTMVSESSALAGGVAYKYVEKNGTVSYTEQWDLIPPVYRGQVLILDGDTLEPLNRGLTSTSPAPRHKPGQATDATRPASALFGFGDWWNRGIRELSGLSVPFSTSFRLGVALTAFTVIAGIMIILQMTTSPGFKVLLRSVIVMMLGLATYAMFLSGVTENFAAITVDRPAPSIAGREVIGAVHNQANRITTSVESLNPLASFTQSVQETIHTPHTPLTKAKHAAQQTEQANRRLEHRLADLDSFPNGTEAGRP